MFEINKYNSNEKTYWIKMIDTKTSIILTYINDDKLIDLRVFNENTIYHIDFPIKGKKVHFKSVLSLDGNEFDIIVSSKKDSLFLNLYYSLDSNLVISIVENGKRRELITLPNILLN